MGIEVEKIHPEDAPMLEEFECIICRNFPEEPKQCDTCKKHFCNTCIIEWTEKNRSCPIKCNPSGITIKELEAEPLSRYNNLRMLCNKNCGKYIALVDYLDHITLCNLPDCTPTCGRKTKYVYNGINTCSYNCLVKNHPDVLADPLLNEEKIKASHPDVDLSRFFPVIFDPAKASSELTVTSLNSFMSKSDHNEFQTVLSKVGLLGGIHRFEFTTGKAQHPVKVGATKDDTVPKDTAFSDFENGFAFFTVGQSRNDSNASGLLYGNKLDDTVVNKIKMEISMGEGKMRFGTNGETFGTCFEEELLKSGPFYVAISVRKNIDETSVIPVATM